jgi:hypothetical protein
MRAHGRQVVLALVVSGCGETNIQAIQRLSPTYALRREELAAVVRALPPPGSVEAVSLPEAMWPPVVFSERETNDTKATAEILQVEDLVGEPPPLSLSIRSPLHFCLDWTGPKNPLDRSVFGDRGRLGAECEAALRRPWLLLLRTVEIRLPERLRMEVLIIHLPTKRLVGTLPVVVRGRYTEADLGQGPWATDALGKARSAFWLAAQCELGLMLNRMPGARVAMDRPGCAGSFREIALPASLTPDVAPEDEPPGEP